MGRGGEGGGEGGVGRGGTLEWAWMEKGSEMVGSERERERRGSKESAVGW